jgi:hypothetical protein
VSAVGEISQGTSIRSVSLSGAWNGGRLTLAGQGGESFEVVADGDRVSGTWTPRAGARASAWSATRR